jgi:hypothetical protein
MSLINDALKRAQQTQAQNPPPPTPLELRPAEPTAHPTGRPTLVLVALALVVVLLVGLAGTLIWYVSHTRSANVRAAARTANLPAVPPAPTAGAEEASLETATKFEHPREPDTNRVPVLAEVVAEVVAEVRPVVAVLKLQGIAFDPQKPSAIINGRTLYLGDVVEDFRLIGISPVAVTLVSATETNVLSLSR